MLKLEKPMVKSLFKKEFVKQLFLQLHSCNRREMFKHIVNITLSNDTTKAYVKMYGFFGDCYYYP